MMTHLEPRRKRNPLRTSFLFLNVRREHDKVKVLLELHVVRRSNNAPKEVYSQISAPCRATSADACRPSSKRYT
jgi:hypothetical protein